MLRGKIVLITGAASGIGAETAKLLAAAGAIPILTGRRLDKLREVADAIGGTNGCYKMDVTDNDEVERAVQLIAKDFGRIDILLNNAGYGVFELFADAPIERFQEMMDTNYMGIIRCTKAVLPIMQKQGGGHIINVASMAGKLSTSKSSGYAATKHAVLGLTNAMRSEFASMNIYVSAINPGPIDTPFLHIADPQGHYASKVQGFMLKPARVAEVIVQVMKRRKPEVDLPRSASIGIRIYGLFPRLADRLAGRWLNRK
ncbi:SDR family NAD(P)-dependent oxidoreductase [Paenibacillus lignilyticus]|uniref:SDR family oxidoreductase n=1 Tax=Paenibacillus lignilyticus TaxID=1172615 RepID=A0ABS5C9E8_9BACL|nr:SDR family oxidoreductase [Paenibacillus lignilyticus]MBP3962045.1 SDR family oxidoreductase [Paenibacillus lignilyticus]